LLADIDAQAVSCTTFFGGEAVEFSHYAYSDSLTGLSRVLLSHCNGSLLARASVRQQKIIKRVLL